MEPIIQYFDLNYCNLQKQTALHHEAKWGRLHNLSFLLKYGANIEALDSLSYSPLCYAIEGNHTEVVEFLIGNGANCFNTELYNPQPFLLAIKNKNINMLSLLFKS